MMETIVVDLALPAAGIERCIKEAGIAFMFAPNFYPTMKHIVTVRKAPAARQQRCLGGATARYLAWPPGADSPGSWLCTIYALWRAAEPRGAQRETAVRP